MRFTKMHGLGNDFIVVDAIHNAIPDPAGLARRICQRRFAIGADGLILIGQSDRADATMRIYNSDGSEAEMCGNGIRCVAKYLYDHDLCKKQDMTIDTLAGLKPIRLRIEGEAAAAATVDMGAPDLEPAHIPVAANTNRVRIPLGGREVEFFCVSLGNPHAVTFDIFPDEDQFLRWGPELERHPLFPARMNVEFCRLDGPDAATVKVWERGAGPTLACGTGSCAVLVAGASLGLLERSADIHLPGGTLHNEWREDGHIYMTGPAVVAGFGEFEA